MLKKTITELLCVYAVFLRVDKIVPIFCKGLKRKEKLSTGAGAHPNFNSSSKNKIAGPAKMY